MATFEYLNLVANVVDSFSAELTQLSAMLEEVGMLGEAIDPITIDVDVDNSELATAQSHLASMEGMDTVFGDGGGTSMSDVADGLGDVAEATENVVADGGDTSLGKGVPFGGLDFGEPGTGGPFSRNMGFGSSFDGIFTGFFGQLGEADDQLDSITDQIKELDLSMSDFYDVIASLLPLLLTFIGTLPAVITAVGALATAALGAAAALGGLIGLGALGAGMDGGEFSLETLRSELSDIFDTFIETFSPLASMLQPLFRDALRGLDELFRQLADQGDVLLAFRDDARALGQFLLDTLPGALAELMAFADAMSPIFADIADFFAQADLIGFFAREMEEMLPTLGLMAVSIASLLPLIVDLSQGFVDVVAVITSAVAVGSQFINFLTNLYPILGAVIAVVILGVAAFTSMISPILGIAVAVVAIVGIFGDFTRIIGGVIGAMLAFITVGLLGAKVTALWGAALEFFSSRALLGSFLTSIQQMIVALTGLNVTLAQTAALVAAVTGGLSLLAGGLVLGGGGFNIFGGTANATKSLSQFNQRGTRFERSGTAGSTQNNVYNVQNNTTIEAPDAETGKRVSRRRSYEEGTAIDTSITQG